MRGSGSARGAQTTATRIAACLAAAVTIVSAGPSESLAAGLDGPLRTLAQERGRVAGAAVGIAPLQGDPLYAQTLAAEYSSVTAENEMKWATLQPSEGNFDFSKGDTLVAFADTHGMRVRGHTLAWHEQLPAWVTGKPCDRQTMIAVLQSHITTVVSHFAGKVDAWDVVNEAVGEDGQLRPNIWLTCIGSDYVDLAFQWARQADPNAALYYNDYGIESFTGVTQPHASGVHQLLGDLRGRGVPVDGVGLQGHLGLDAPSQSQLEDALGRYRSLGLRTAFTELDVRVPVNGLGEASNTDLVRQQRVYRRVAAACAGDVSCDEITTWGFTDNHSWIPGRYPGQGAALPFDRQYQPKPAYYGLREGLGEPTALVEVHQAENAPRKDNGDPFSGGWRLRSNGAVRHDVVVSKAGRYRFSIVAQSEQGLVQAPAHMRVYLDGVLLGEVDASTTSWTVHAFEADTTVGTHELAIAFTNDAFTADGDRNLLVDRTTVSPVLLGRELPLASAGQAIGDDWSLPAGGRVGSPFSVEESGTYTFVLRVRVSGAASAPIRLLVDGADVGGAVANATLQTYELTVPLQGGHHHVVVQHGGVTGALLVRSLGTGTAGAPSPTS